MLPFVQLFASSSPEKLRRCWHTISAPPISYTVTCGRISYRSGFVADESSSKASTEVHLEDVAHDSCLQQFTRLCGTRECRRQNAILPLYTSLDIHFSPHSLIHAKIQFQGGMRLTCTNHSYMPSISKQRKIPRLTKLRTQACSI